MWSTTDDDWKFIPTHQNRSRVPTTHLGIHTTSTKRWVRRLMLTAQLWGGELYSMMVVVFQGKHIRVSPPTDVHLVIDL
jgi:hypothetical protein